MTSFSHLPANRKFFLLQIVRPKENTISQAEAQSEIVLASAPAQLHWHFMQPLTYGYVSEQFLKLSFPIIAFLTS